MRPEGSERFRTDATFDALEELESVAAGARRVDRPRSRIAWLLDVPEVTAVVVGPNTVAQLGAGRRGRSGSRLRGGRASPGSRRSRRERPRPLGAATCAQVLDMESCIDAMEEALAALARDELTMPLRFVFRPGGEQLLGLMPAHRGGDDAAVLAQGDRRSRPANARARARPAPGRRAPPRRRDGRPAGGPERVARSPRSAPPPSPRSRRSSSPGPARDASRSSAPASRGAPTREAMRTVVDDPELRVWSRTPAHAEALALESHAVVCETVEEALDGAEIVCTCTAVARADRPARVARTGRARQRRRLVRSVRARARGGRRRRGVALRRPARVDAERVRRLPAGGRGGAASGRTTSAPSSASCSSAAHPGAERRRADGLQVARPRRRGPRRGGALRRARPRARARRRGAVLIPLEAIERARGAHRRRRRRDPARPARRRRAVRDLAQARVPPADRLFKLRGAASAIRQAEPAEWRDGVWTTSAGNMAQGVCWVARELGVPATVVAPDHAPRAKLDAIERLGGRVDPRPVRPLVGDDGGRRLPRARRALRPPGARRARDGRQRRHRARARRAAGRDRHGARALGRRRAYDRHRERARGRQPGDTGRSPASRRRARPSPRRSLPASRSTVDYRAVVRRRRRLEGAAPRDVGARAAARSPARSPCRSRDVAAAVAAARDAGARRRRGRGRARARRRARRPRRRRSRRLHRLGRQHRRRPARGDPRRARRPASELRRAASSRDGDSSSSSVLVPAVVRRR